MDTVERTFLLEAKEGLGARPRPELIGPVLAYLHDTLQDTVRLGYCIPAGRAGVSRCR